MPFCKLIGHPPSRCLKVTNNLSRKDILRKSGLCFICFGEHLASQCKSQYRCNKCKGKHHISICTFNENKPYDLKNYQQTEQSTSTNFSADKNAVLLQTAYVEVKNPNHSKKKNSHLLFDTGSQRTYISNSLRRDLQLPTLRTETLKIKTFGSNNFKSETVDIVPLILVGNEKLITVEARRGFRHSQVSRVTKEKILGKKSLYYLCDQK